MTRYESRGIRCLDCIHVDLQGDKEAARRGFGRCAAHSPPPYVSVIAARNCFPFDPAPDEVVQARDAWAERTGPVLGMDDVQQLTVQSSRAWQGGCNCPPNQCRVKDARKCQNWTLRNNNFRNEQKQA